MANATNTNAAGADRLVHQEENILEVSHLKKYFPVKGGFFGGVTGEVKAVDDVSFSIKKGTTMGLVGESGCGNHPFQRGGCQRCG